MFQPKPNLDPHLPSIPSNYSRLLAQELKLQATNLELLLEDTGLSTEDFLQEETLLSLIQQIKITENGLKLSNDTAFGFCFSRRLTLITHGPIGFLAISSPNLYQAFKAFEIYFPARLAFLHMQVSTDKQWTELVFDVNFPLEEPIVRFVSETILSVIFECADFFLGRPLTECLATLPYDEPVYSTCYRESFPGQIAFSASKLSLKIPSDLCYETNNSANHENFLFAQRQCELMVKQLQGKKSSYKYRIQKMMLSLPPGRLTEEEAAASLFISKSTLARKLKKEETGFRQIRDETLSEQAKEYLCNGHMSTEEIAALLNYHDSANFRRAFKRWFGVPPDQYRRQYNHIHRRE